MARRLARMLLVALAVLAVVLLIAWRLFGPWYRAASSTTQPTEEIPTRLQARLAMLPPDRSVRSPERLRAAEQMVAGWMREAGFRVELQAVPGTPELHNVLAWHDEAPAPRWLLGAHLDVVPGTPGADDNGSAVAIAVEVARSLGARQAPVVFAFFTEEESGLKGSRYLATRLPPDVTAAVVMDLIGFTAKEQAYPFPFGVVAPNRGDFVAAVTLFHSRWLIDSLVDARNAAAPGLALLEVSPPLAIAERIPDLWRSDHAPLWRHDVPTVFLTDTANFWNPNYHRVTDTPQTLDAVFMARVVETLVAMFSSPPRKRGN